MGTSSFPKSYSHTVALSYVHIYFFPIWCWVSNHLWADPPNVPTNLPIRCQVSESVPTTSATRGCFEAWQASESPRDWYMIHVWWRSSHKSLLLEGFIMTMNLWTELRLFFDAEKTIKSWTWKNYNSSPTFSLKERWTLELEGINYTIATPTTRPRTLAASLAHLLWSPQNMWGDDGRCGCVSEIWSRSEVIRHMYYCRLKLCIWSLGMANANWSEFKNVACLERRIITLDWKSVLHKWCHAINCSIQDV